MKKLLIALISAAVLSLAAFELGKSPCTIYHIARNALQAKEMAAFLRKVYGQQYTVKLFREKYRKSPGIFIGVRPAGLQMEFDESREYCVRHIAGDQLYLFGNQDIRLKGTAFAVYDFLEEVCGVRYLWPGELGTVADPAKPVTLKDSTEKRVPFFIRRMVNSYHYGINSLAGRDAYALNRWQEHHRVGTSCFGSAAHAFAALLPREKYGKTHPPQRSFEIRPVAALHLQSRCPADHCGKDCQTASGVHDLHLSQRRLRLLRMCQVCGAGWQTPAAAGVRGQRYDQPDV